MRLWIFALALPLVAAVTGAEGPNAFAVDLYSKVSRQPGNLVFSPFSVSTALAMALTGARGHTAAEMRSVLRNPPDAALLDQLSKAAGADQLSLAQSLWVDRGFALRPEFVSAMEHSFRAQPRPAGFSTNPEEARKAINAWVTEQTKDKIRDLFGAGSLGRDTRLVLASAIYFKGKWQSPFEANATRPESFRPAAGAPTEIPFMNQTGRFPYAETSTVQILEMPYGGSLAFDVVLPKPGTTLATVEGALGQGGLAGWLGQLQRKQVAVALPKFRVESQFALNDALGAMGMAGAFTSAADFSGMDGRRDLAISKVVHKAFIDVSEEGTEAAAATGIAVALTAYAQPVTFRADHPFLFFIRDTASGTILFAGRLEQPSH